MKTVVHSPCIAWVILLCAALAPSSALSFPNAVSVTAVNPDAYVCAQPGLVDFEAYPDAFDLTAAAVAGVQFTTTDGFTWLVGDFATGRYNGKYPSGSYTSQGTHWAWLGTAQGAGRIDFVNGPASVFSLLVSNYTSVWLDAYDAGGNLLATAGPGASNTGTGLMNALEITRAAKDIAYVVVHDTGNLFEVDVICTDAPGVGNQQPDVTVSDVSGAEGAAIVVSGTASDPDGDALSYAWAATPAAGVDPGAQCAFADPDLLSTTVSCTDDGTYQLTLTVDDGHGVPVLATGTLTVTNAVPVLQLDEPGDGALYAINAQLTVAAPYQDPGANDTHTCAIVWDDSTADAFVGTGGCDRNHAYATAGVYSITVTVTDDDGGSAARTVMVVVYDPTAGFVAGGGWFVSPPGAYLLDLAATGRANFGFVSKYQKGATVPTGQTEFQFQAGNLSFHSDAYQWLVIAGARAQYKGTGTLNGTPGYGFLLTARDGSIGGGGGGDAIRIKIWDQSGTVYDSAPGSEDVDSSPLVDLSGGDVHIQKR